MDRLGGFWLIVIPAWVWALLPLWAASGVVVCVLEWMCLFLTGAPVALAWLCNSPLLFEALKGRARRQWFSVPIVWAVALPLAASDVPTIARLWLSEPALRDYAEGDTSGPSRDSSAKSIGLYHVSVVWRHERMVAFTTGANFLDTFGVIYAPDGLPTELPMEVESLLWARYTHLYGPWYRFELGG